MTIKTYPRELLRIFFALNSLLFSINVISQPVNQSFQIDGTLISPVYGTLYLTYYSSIRKKRIDDSCKIVRGKFAFRGMLSEPAVAFLSLTKEIPINSQTTTMFIEPGLMQLKLTTDPVKVKMISGPKTQFEYENLNAKKKILETTYKKTIAEFETAEDGKRKDEIEIELAPYYKATRQLDIDFFTTYPQSFVTGFLLQYYYRSISIDSLQAYYNAMGKILKESIYGDQLQDIIQRKSLRVSGKKAPDFTSITNSGQIISLSDFRGRYILLDFWAHWCVPCRKSSPKLIQLFNKYHLLGLEIIGVADDDFKTEEWTKAIESDKIGIWYNVLRGLQKNKGEEVDKTKSINDMYNVQVLPAKVLIDHSGIIIGRYEGTEADEKLEKKLSKIFE